MTVSVLERVWERISIFNAFDTFCDFFPLRGSLPSVNVSLSRGLLVNTFTSVVVIGSLEGRVLPLRLLSTDEGQVVVGRSGGG